MFYLAEKSNDIVVTDSSVQPKRAIAHSDSHDDHVDDKLEYDDKLRVQEKTGFSSDLHYPRDGQTTHARYIINFLIAVHDEEKRSARDEMNRKKRDEGQEVLRTEMNNLVKRNCW